MNVSCMFSSFSHRWLHWTRVPWIPIRVCRESLAWEQLNKAICYDDKDRCLWWAWWEVQVRQCRPIYSCQIIDSESCWTLTALQKSSVDVRHGLYDHKPTQKTDRFLNRQGLARLVPCLPSRLRCIRVGERERERDFGYS